MKIHLPLLFLLCAACDPIDKIQENHRIFDSLDNTLKSNHPTISGNMLIDCAPAKSFEAENECCVLANMLLTDINTLKQQLISGEDVQIPIDTSSCHHYLSSVKKWQQAIYSINKQIVSINAGSFVYSSQLHKSKKEPLVLKMAILSNHENLIQNTTINILKH